MPAPFDGTDQHLVERGRNEFKPQPGKSILKNPATVPKVDRGIAKDFDKFVECVTELGFYWVLLNKPPY